MEGSGGRARQRARTLRIPSRNKTLRSSGDADDFEVEVTNPERKLMVDTAPSGGRAKAQRREGTTQSNSHLGGHARRWLFL